ncbi:unnamed protein product [Nippostrongylus brasiliensis]|uniref:Secreted protein n=1 Tax=Nippostrongylus brasiliensis TaxID=27835 RepID=A0A0N4YNB6_NIPBR|nr:unnamed protein product [Nippostrongylus brasiliensis]
MLLLVCMRFNGPRKVRCQTLVITEEHDHSDDRSVTVTPTMRSNRRIGFPRRHDTAVSTALLQQVQREDENVDEKHVV